jgi:hypothetical protein
MHPKHALLTVPYRVLRRSSSISLSCIAAVTLLAAPAAATPMLSVSSVLSGASAVISGASDLVSLLGLGSSAPTKLMFDFSATQTSVSLSLIGTAINSDFNDTFTGTATDTVTLASGGTATVGLWTYQLALNLENGAINDSMAINGFVKHAIGPHPGDDVNGPQLTFNLTVDADKAVATPAGQEVSASDAPKSLPHPGLTPAHSDILASAGLTATVVTSFPGFIDDINGFTFQTMAVHTPEPTMAFLIAIGCVLLFAYRGRTI